MGFASCCRLQAFLVKIRKEEADFEELQVIYIGVENNTIIDISFYTCEEDPYPDYDYTNLLIM